MDLFIAALAASPMAAIFSLCIRSTHQRLNAEKSADLLSSASSTLHAG